MSKQQSNDAPQKRVSCKNDFELCYLRHQYLRKVEINPSKEEIELYVPIAKNIAKKTYSRHRTLLFNSGFGIEDVISIATTQIVSYLGLFAIEKNQEKLECFVDKYVDKNNKVPNIIDVLDKNKANFTLFLKQRMDDLVRVCIQKSKNIKGSKIEDFVIFCGPNKPPKIIFNLLKNHEKQGFKKVQYADYKILKKKLKIGEEPLFFYDGLWYIKVPIESRNLTNEDIAGADLDPKENTHNMDPEKLCIYKDSESDLSLKIDKFKKMENKKKAIVVKKFIAKNRGNSTLKEELVIARRYLNSLEY